MTGRLDIWNFGPGGPSSVRGGALQGESIMKKQDVIAGFIAALENSDGDIRPFLTGWFSKAFDEGDKDAARIIAAVAVKDAYVKKYLDKRGRGPLRGDPDLFGEVMK